MDHQYHVHNIDEANDHAHLSHAHFIQDISHGDHHDGTIADIDVSQDGLLKYSNSIFALALIIFIFSLVIFVTSQRQIIKRWEAKLIFHLRYILSPPLRAPPQY